MKKLIYAVFFLFSLQMAAHAQTAIIDENFLEPVSGWEMTGNWEQDEGYLLLYYYPIAEDYDFSAYTPEFEVPVNGGDVIVNQFVDVYTLNATNEKCAITVVTENGDEDVIWEHDLTDGPWGEIAGTDLFFDLNDYTGQTVKLRFRSWGATTEALWGWFVFNINFVTFFDHELCALDLTGPGNLDPNENGTWQLNVQNLGLNAEDGFTVNLYSEKQNEIIGSGNYDGTLNPTEVAPVSINWATDVVQNTVLYAEIESTTDQYPANNRSKGKFLRIEPDMAYNVLLWDNDNGIETIVNPETNVLEQPHQGLERMLSEAGINYDYVSELPDNLEEYNIVISTMGCYCLS